MTPDCKLLRLKISKEAGSDIKNVNQVGSETILFMAALHMHTPNERRKHHE